MSTLHDQQMSLLCDVRKSEYCLHNCEPVEGMDLPKGSRFNTTAVRRYMRQYGWVCRRKDGHIIDVCPNCVKKEKDEAVKVPWDTALLQGLLIIMLTSCAGEIVSTQEAEKLDPSHYDTYCENSSDCEGHSIYCDHGALCADFAANVLESSRIEQDRAGLYCPPSGPAEEIGACESTGAICENNTCVVY